MKRGSLCTTPQTAVVVPAHNEEQGIPHTVESLLATDYPPDRRRVIVIADNCTDNTTAAARSAGAEVAERVDDARRSKGFALGDVLPTLLADESVDAIVIVDADTVVSTNLLIEVDAVLRAGADAVQVAYGVRNAEASWRTRLMSIALACFHDVRSLGRERLHLSCGLRGNGMAFSRHALTAVPPQAHGLVEDAEHGIALAMAGIRVHYVHNARVFGEMPTTGGAARSQRHRWEEGRRDLRRRMTPTLVREALRRRDPVLADIAVDLCVPPLGQLVTAQTAGLALCVAGTRLLGRPLRSGWIWGAGLGGVVVHVARGWHLSGTGARGLIDLMKAPWYVAWKVATKVRAKFASKTTRTGARDTSHETNPPWVRTQRQQPKDI